VDGNTRYGEIPVSPRAALILTNLGRRLVLKYDFSMAYVSPAHYFVANIFDNGAQISTGNPDLKPERAMSHEINVVWEPSNLLVSASAYYNRQSDLLITAQSEAPETVISPMVYVNPDGTGVRRLTQSVNFGQSQALGFDVLGRYSVTAFSASVSYSFVSFRRTLGSRVEGLDQISRHNVRAGITLNLLRNLAVTPSLVFRTTPENLPATYENAGTSLRNPYEVNLAALYAPWKTVDLFMTVQNVTSHHYALRGVSGPALQEPRVIMGGLRLRH
jgi:outer membrane receptor protein involved in Fe transport